MFWENAADAPSRMPVGFYWYFRPNYNATEQADYFCELIMDEDWLLPPVLDIESTGGLGSSVVGDRCAEFVARVYAKTGKWPIIYTRGYFWNDHVNWRSVFDECDLWIARYTKWGKPWGNVFDSSKLKPFGWSDWTFWQYSDENNRAVELGGLGPPAGDDDVDLNWFNGDEAAFNEYVGYTVVELPEVVEVKTGKNGLLLSQIGGDYIAVAPFGLRLGVVGVDKDEQGRDWYDVGGLWTPSWYVKEV